MRLIIYSSEIISQINKAYKELEVLQHISSPVRVFHPSRESFKLLLTIPKKIRAN
jgi:hypothetical protein